MIFCVIMSISPWLPLPRMVFGPTFEFVAEMPANLLACLSNDLFEIVYYRSDLYVGAVSINWSWLLHFVGLGISQLTWDLPGNQSGVAQE